MLGDKEDFNSTNQPNPNPSPCAPFPQKPSPNHITQAGKHWNCGLGETGLGWEALGARGTPRSQTEVWMQLGRLSQLSIPHCPSALSALLGDSGTDPVCIKRMKIKQIWCEWGEDRGSQVIYSQSGPSQHLISKPRDVHPKSSQKYICKWKEETVVEAT